jgi:hypothetical protein
MPERDAQPLACLDRDEVSTALTKSGSRCACPELAPPGAWTEKMSELGGQFSQDFGCGLDLLDVIHRLTGIQRHCADLAANVSGCRART